MGILDTNHHDSGTHIRTDTEHIKQSPIRNPQFF